MSESGILTVHLRGPVSQDVLRDELARLFGVDREILVPLDDATPDTLIPYQYTPRSRGFLVTIEVYAGRAPASGPASDLALARALARNLAQDVLISPPAHDGQPFAWLLMRPDGSTANVIEVPSDEEEDGIVIAEPSP